MRCSSGLAALEEAGERTSTVTKPCLWDGSIRAPRQGPRKRHLKEKPELKVFWGENGVGFWGVQRRGGEGGASWPSRACPGQQWSFPQARLPSLCHQTRAKGECPSPQALPELCWGQPPPRPIQGACGKWGSSPFVDAACSGGPAGWRACCAASITSLSLPGNEHAQR